MPGFDLASILTGAVSGLGDGISKVVNSINAPKEMVAQVQAQVADLLSKHKDALLAAQVEMEKQHADEKASLLLDVQNARNTNATIQVAEKASWLSKNIPYVLAIFMTAIWGGATAFTFDKMFLAPPLTNTGPIALMYGGVSSLFGTILSFYFGSTHSSKNKDATIAQQAATIASA